MQIAYTPSRARVRRRHNGTVDLQSGVPLHRSAERLQRSAVPSVHIGTPEMDGGRPETERKGPDMADVIPEVTTEMLQAFAEAWNRHDVDALMSFMTEDCVFEASAGSDVCGTRYVGRESVRAGFAEVWAIFPDAHWGNARHFVRGERGVSEWTSRERGRTALAWKSMVVICLPFETAGFP